jgi:hypothetical protein
MPKPLILFLAANPQGTDRVALDQECAAIERELLMTPARNGFELRSKWAVTINDLIHALRDLKPAIIHFAGHGNATGIVLHGDDGVARAISGDTLTAMIESTGKSPCLAVLNACYTDVQAQPLSDLVGCAIGMNGTISDDAARAFSIAFYGALGSHYSAYSAFRQAQAALAALGLDKQAAPRCITRADVDASALLLSTSAVPPASQRNDSVSPAPPEPSRVPVGGVTMTSTNTAGRDIKQVNVGPVNAGDVTTLAIGVGSDK